MSILESIGGAVASGLIFLAGLLGYSPEPVYAPVDYVDEFTVGADTVLPLGGQTYTLSGSGISSSATSFTLTSFTIPQNGKKIQDSEMGDTFYVTFETGSRTRQEFASCTTVVQNGDGTATISGCTRGLSPVSPYTASTSLQFAHGGGTSVIFSNSPQFYNQFAAKGNDETITGQWTFTTFPITASTSIASATTSGIVELATGDEAASSTLSGDIASSRLALHTGIATSAAPVSGNVVVVTGDDGNIDRNFLPSNIGSSTIRFITTTGTSTYTKPVDLKHVVIELQGAGGDGATDGAGGGGGAYLKKVIFASTLLATTNLYVSSGAGGPGATLFGGFATSTDGADASGITGGTGGTATGGDVNIVGQLGESVVSATAGVGGAGGDSILGYGGAQNENPSVTSIRNGTAGTGYGGGGSGGASASDGSPTGGTGGTGAQGAIIITEYF